MESQENKSYYFAGIKGSGMSSLALVLHQRGYNVQGSDVEEYFFTWRDPEKLGVPILSFNADNIDKDMTVTVGNTFPDTHEEIARAIKLGVEAIRYYNFIARFIEPYTSIAVTGSYGRTSTTGSLAHVLSDINPTSYLIGDGTGHGKPDVDLSAFEAYEYRRHSLAYSPDYAIMANIDFDHPDYYKGVEDVFSASQTMAHQAKRGISAYGDDKYFRQLESEVPVYYYGVSEEDGIQAQNIRRTMEGSSFDAYHKDDFVGHLVLSAFGHHNIMNVLGVIAVAYFEKLDIQKVAEEMLNFKGVKHRFSKKKVSDMTIVDDYVYHPAEIKTATDGARQKCSDKEIIAAFQPHTLTRTIALVDELVEVLDLADEVFLYDIFGFARETQGEVRIEDLGEKIQKGGQVTTEDNVPPLLDFENAVVVLMGAGDAQKFGQAYETLLSSTTRNVL